MAATHDARRLGCLTPARPARWTWLVAARVLLACAPPRADAPSSTDASETSADAAAAGEADARAMDANGPDATNRLDAGPLDVPMDADPRAPTGATSLVSPELWTALGPFQDPFADRPDVVTCSASAVAPETLSAERVLGVDTGGCNYLTVTQPTRREVAAGELLKVRLWHFELSAPDPAQAHAALLVDGLTVVDEHLPIPQPGGLIVQQVRAERAIPAGAAVLFHLHNHGANSWALVEVSAGGG